MSARVYMLLDIVEGKSAGAVQVLRTRAGVVITDILEGRPDIIVMIEASNRQRLAEFIMPILDSVNGITEDVHLLVTRENRLAPDFYKPGTTKSCRKQVRNSRKESLVF